MKIITLSICIFCQFTLPAFAEDTVQPVRIAVKEFPPFVFKDLRGFSIDMARIICERHGLKPEFVYYNTVPAVLKAVVTGECDFNFSGTTITSEREKLVDFSYPFFDSGLIVAVKTDSEKQFLHRETDIEKEVAGLWKEILTVPRVGLDDTFFDLGGHSLLLIKLNQKIFEKYNVG